MDATCSIASLSWEVMRQVVIAFMAPLVLTPVRRRPASGRRRAMLAMGTTGRFMPHLRVERPGLRLGATCKHGKRRCRTRLLVRKPARLDGHGQVVQRPASR